MAKKPAATAPSLEHQKLPGATFDGNVESLLDQIGQGLREDDATNLEKLNIARKYGPLLIQLKAIVPHGQFKQVLKERIPRISYSKCNRWMFIARHQAEVAEALVAHPDLAWGPKKMFDFLKGALSLEEVADDDGWDEDDCWGGIALDDDDEGQQSDTEAHDGPDKGNLDDQPQSDPRSHWEEMAAKAESDARGIGKQPVVASSDGVVTVTVFSPDDHTLIQGCLSKWEPTSIPVYGSKDASHMTVTVKPKQIPEILLQLGKTLKQSLPSQLKVTIEL